MKKNYFKMIGITLLTILSCLTFNKSLISYAETINVTSSSTGQFTFGGLGDIYLEQGGGLEYINDGDDETFCWFTGSPTPNESYILLELPEVTSIGDVRVLFHNTDLMTCKLQYSLDGTTFEDMCIINKNKYVYDIRDQQIDAKYLRLLASETNGGSWVKIYDFSYNNMLDKPIVSYDGLTFIDREWNDKNNMIDEDMDTYTWFDWKNEPGAYIALTYLETQTINSIYIFTSHDETTDHFEKMFFSYSVDGINFIEIENSTYIDEYEVVLNLESPINAKAIRVTAPEQENSGFAIREFGINHTLVDAPISFDKESTYTYQGTSISPTYAIPFMTTASITYTKNSTFYSNEAPVEPGWYALVVKVNANGWYKETEMHKVFLIQDTKEHFIEKWNDALQKGVCNYAYNSSNEEYENLLYIYSECLSAEVKNEIKDYVWNEVSTIADTIAYIECIKALNTASNSNVVNLLVIDNTHIFLVALVIGITSLLFVSYYLFNKKKYVK